MWFLFLYQKRSILRYYELYYGECNSHPNVCPYLAPLFLLFIIHAITCVEICIFAYVDKTALQITNQFIEAHQEW